MPNVLVVSLWSTCRVFSCVGLREDDDGFQSDEALDESLTGLGKYGVSLGIRNECLRWKE